MNDPLPPAPWGRRPLPARSDWRRALDVYVAGRSRAITHDEKRSIAASGVAGRADEAPDVDVPPKPSFGVSVPDQLDYYRNAGTWRDRLSGADGRDAS